MGIGNLFSKAYAKLENGFFSIMDFFENRGIPVYNYVDFLEKKGIPVFPFTLGLLVFLAMGVWLLFFSAPASVFLTASFKDDAGSVLNEVGFSITSVADGKSIYAQPTDSAQKIELKGFAIGSRLSLKAEKEGFESTEQELTLSGTENRAFMELARDIEIITAKVRLFDSETGDLVRNAKVTAEFEGRTLDGILNEDGSYSFIGVPANTQLTIKVKADSYEDEEKLLSFASETINSLNLSPKASATTGKTNIIFKVFDSETKQLVENALVKVFEKDSDRELTSDIAVQGELLVQLEKGKSIRWTASKEEYATYDSVEKGLFLTLRNDDESIEIMLEKGGADIAITAIDRQSGSVLSDAIIFLYNQNGEKIDENITGFGGFVQFQDLNVESKYYISAFKEGFLPAGKSISPRERTATIEMENAIAGNVANVGVFVIDSAGMPVNNASLEFFEKTDIESIPLRIPEAVTDVSGYFGAGFRAGTVLEVRASKDNAFGNAAALLDATSSNKIEIMIAGEASVVELFFQDNDQNPINEGSIAITSNSGNELFDGNIENARITFNTQGNKLVNLRAEIPEYGIFEQALTLTGEAKQAVTLGDAIAEGSTPEIRLLRIENSSGEEVEGLVKGEEGFLVFETVWPEGLEKGGVHVRVGSDAVKNAESQEIAIIGFDAIAQGFFYGRTYNPSPAPGNESIDYLNKGSAETANKFLELRLEKPEGNKIFKARVKLSEDAALKQEVHYRAWGLSNGQVLRNPQDSILLLSEYSKQRLSLYAETTTEQVNVFDAEKNSCNKELCASFKFLNSGFNSFEAKDFKAAKGETYAMEITLSGKDTANAVIKASTSRENPLIGFQGSDIDAFGEMPISELQDTSIEVQNVIVEKDKEAIIRIYFKALKPGSSGIQTQVIGESLTINQSLAFNVFEEKLMTAVFRPEASSDSGQAFRIILNSEGKTPVENATIVFKDSTGKEAYRILGNGRADKGRLGNYKAKGVFKPGVLDIEITAPGFKPLQASYSISQVGALKMPESVELKIPSAARTADAEIIIENTSSSEINDLAFEIEKPSGFDQKFTLEITEQAASLAALQKQTLRITASYDGNEENASAQAVLKAFGTLGENIPVKASTKIILSYNKKFDSACLEATPAALQTTLYYNPADSSTGQQFQGYNYNQGYSTPSFSSRYSNYSNYYPQASQYSTGGVKQVQLFLKNNCEEDLILNPETRQQNIQLSGLSVAVPEVELAKGEAKEVIIDIENKLARAFFQTQSVDFGIDFKAEQLTKTVPLRVSIMSIRFALQAPDTLHIFTASGQESSTPLFARNIGNSAIENLTFETGSGYGEGIELRLEPERSYVVLPPGQSVFPPLLVVAKADVEKSKVFRQIIDIKGSIDGREYNLKTVNVFVHASSPSCLRVAPLEAEFVEQTVGEGAKTTELTISNYCLEDVRITDLEPKTIGSNSLDFIAGSTGGTIPVNGSMKIQLRIAKKDEIDTKVPLIFYGALIQSGKRIQTDAVGLSVKFGKEAARDEGLTSAAADLKKCENPSETINVKFPKLASGNDCSNGYCDAEQLANFLAEKIARKVSETESAIIAKNKSPEGYCTLNPRACSFSDLGVKPETFTIYFQHDQLSTELLRSVIENDKFAGIKGYQVNFFDASPTSNILEVVAGKGFARQILMPRLQGCGKFKVRIDGAVDVIASEIQSGRETVAVFLLDRQETAECTAEIQNFQNFLPADITLDYSSSLGTWLGTTDSAQGLEDSAKQIAKGLFGKETRFVKGSTSNKILLDKKSLTQGLVEISMEFSNAPQQPVTIKAFMNADALANEQKRKAVLQEAATAINNLKSNAPASESCITADKKTLRISAAGEVIGSIALTNCIPEIGNAEKPKAGEQAGASAAKAPEPSAAASEKQEPASAGKQTIGTVEESKLSIMPGTQTCCAFKVLGNIQNQSVGLKIEELQSQEQTFPGLQWDKTFLKEKASGKSSQNGKLDSTLSQKEKTAGNFSNGFQLCTTGDRLFAEANAKELTITASDKSKLNEEEHPESKKTSLEACAIHPYDLMDDLTKTSFEKEKKQKEFYALVSWKDEPSEIRLGDLANAMEANEELRDKLNGKHFVINGIKSEKSESRTAELGVAEFKPIIAYLGACAGAHLAGDYLLGLIPGMQWKFATALGSTAIDCGIPAGIGGVMVYQNTLQSSPIALANSIEKAAEGIGDYALEVVGITEDELLQEANAPGQTALGSGIALTSVKNVLKTGSGFLKSLTDKLKNYITSAQTGGSYAGSLANTGDAERLIAEFGADAGNVKAKTSALGSIDALQDNLRAEIQGLGEGAKNLKSSNLKLESYRAMAADDALIKELDNVKDAISKGKADDAAQMLANSKSKLKLSLPIDGVPASKLKFKDAERIAKGAVSRAGVATIERASLAERLGLKTIGKGLGGIFRLTSSIGVGVASNYVGYLAYKKAVQFQKPLQNQMDIDCGEEGGDCTLLKNSLYKIAVQDKGNKQLGLSIDRVDSIRDSKTEVLKRCDGSFAGKGLEEVREFQNAQEQAKAEKPANAQETPA